MIIPKITNYTENSANTRKSRKPASKNVENLCLIYNHYVFNDIYDFFNIFM
jgi:hypothetical protein